MSESPQARIRLANASVKIPSSILLRWRRIGVVLLLLPVLPGAGAALAETNDLEIDLPPHLYRQRTPQDRFSRLKNGFESGEIALDRAGEKAFVMSMLRTLDIPASSQML